MKKLLITLTIVLSCLGINSVKAANLQLTSTVDLDKFHEMFTDEEFANNINTLINEYKENYYYSYPYYIIRLDYQPYGYHNNGYTVFSFRLSYYNEIPEFYYGGGGNYDGYNEVYIALESSSYGTILLEYVSDYKGIIDFSQKDTLYSEGLLSYPYRHILFEFDKNSHYEVYHNYYSNFDLVLNSLKNFSDDNFLLDEYDNILVPTVTDSTINRVLSLSSDNLGYHFDNLYDYDDKYNSDIFPTSYTEINLNDYAYVALALKDYNQDPFSTQVYVKGNYCLTPVYNYGMTERKDILDGTQVERCSPYYDNFTPIRTSILASDLKNNAIYYLKSYDTTRDNYVKVDTSVFDITYITEEEKDNPYVIIAGKTYPTIPYDNLTDTSTKSEDEGYISGAVDEFSFADIFTAPLDFLKDIWGSISSVFDLIKEFISLLPPVVQSFIYASFILGLSLGLLKLIF